jgi:hypothetical protein
MLASRHRERSQGRSDFAMVNAQASAASTVVSPLRLLDDLVAAVEATPLTTAPFDHLYMERAFPAALYRQLLDRLPATRRYREFRHGQAMQADGHSARRKFYLYPEHVMLLPRDQRALWSPLSRALRSPELQDAFKRKFRGALERRFGRSIDRLTFYPVPMLLRDLGGYRIGIHGDSLSKAITVQFYLPRDDSQAHLGTILHEGRNDDAALRTTTLKFRPATGYAFPVVYHESWHSVARTSDADGERNTLMLTYYVQDGLFGRLLQRLKRAWVFVAYGVRR